MATREIQQESLVNEDLTPYRGTWIAIRDGKVVASALDPLLLRDRSDHRDDDVLMPVPSEPFGAFVL